MKWEDFDGLLDRITSIENRLTALELPNARLGPNPKQHEEMERDRERLVKQIVDSP